MKNKTNIFAVILFPLLILSCHSEYLYTDYGIHHSPVLSPSHNSAALVISRRAYLPAKGISRFPDGGLPEYLMQKVGLFILDLETCSLENIMEFDSLVSEIGSYRSSWSVKIAYTDSTLCCSVSPVGGDTAYSRIYSHNLNTGKTNIMPARLFKGIYKRSSETGITEIKKLCPDFKLAQIGIHVRELFPKPDDSYIEETIYLKNGSPVTRKAVVQQIISKLGKDEIILLLDKMYTHKKNLAGLEKTEYEIRSQDLYDALRKLK